MMKTLLNVVTFGLTMMLDAIALTPHSHAATEVARIGERVITLDEFNAKYQDNLKYFQFRVPTKKEVLSDWIKREVGVLEAKKLKLDQDPEVLDRINTVLYHALLEKRLGKDIETIQIKDSETRSFYEQNPELRTSHIFIAVAPDATDEQEKKAKERIQLIYDQHVKPGKMGFAEIAQKFSEGPAAPMGGDLDYQSKDRMDPVYYAAALKLKSPGKISEIIRSQFGYHIIQLTAIRPWKEADQAQAKRALFEKRRSELFEKFMADLQKSYRVNIQEKWIQ